jgi:cysteine-rich repeat protein
MLSSFQKFLSVFLATLVAVFVIFLFGEVSETSAFTSTTTVSTFVRIVVCGDGIVSDGENCDAGPGRNDGAYSLSIADYRCYPGCMSGAARYCGDGIIQTMYGEECDDSNNLDGDACSTVCKNETAPIEVNPPTGGGGGGGSGGVRGFGARDGTISILNTTRVIIDGKAYPNSLVHVLQDGKQVSVVPTNSLANFHFETSEITPGPVIFGFWVEDADKLRSVVMTTTFQVVQNAVTTVSGVYLPPTIDVAKKTVRQGEKLDVSGTAIASSSVLVYFDSSSVPAQTVTSLLSGKWISALDTSALANEKFHTVKAKTETLASDNTIKRSGFSQSVGFYVGTKELTDIVSPDINGDGKVNIVDFSILLFNWNTNEVTCDFNRDSKVNLTDFSIMLYAWTG